MEIPQSNHHFYTIFAYSFNTKGFAFLSFASGQRICKFSCLLKWSRCQNTVARIQHSGLFFPHVDKKTVCVSRCFPRTHIRKNSTHAKPMSFLFKLQKALLPKLHQNLLFMGYQKRGDNKSFACFTQSSFRCTLLHYVERGQWHSF